MLTRTWDGLPVTEERPYGASVLVWRNGVAGIEWLLLHRAHEGPGYAGDWAWGPPAGARLPGEPVAECARRELVEEVGLDLRPAETPCGSDEWAVYVAELAEGEAPVALSPEHDRYEWAGSADAASRCLPESVAAAFACVERLIRAQGAAATPESPEGSAGRGP